jgi:hypothetical protein
MVISISTYLKKIFLFWAVLAEEKGCTGKCSGNHEVNESKNKHLDIRRYYLMFF